MKKKNIFIFLLILFFVMNPVLSQASSGKELFINKCGKCHGKGKKSKKFAPTKYAASIWERFFKKNKHKRKKDISSLLNDSEIRLIKEYLKEHAADSDQPEAIGLR